MKIEKLLSAGAKLGGAAASGFCGWVMLGITEGNLDTTGMALVGGLGVSAVVLAKQGIDDVVDAFRPNSEE